MTTSFTRGLPSRETCTQPPETVGAPPVSDRVVVFNRQVEDHMLTMALGSDVSVGALWFAVRFWIGTERAIECTLYPAGVLTPPPWPPGSVPGRKLIRSKIMPRSR